MDTAFKHKVSKAVAHMKKILGAHRNFVFPAGSMEHTYDDKFALAEASTKVAPDLHLFRTTEVEKSQGETKMNDPNMFLFLVLSNS